jgi:hypothetical protein
MQCLPQQLTHYLADALCSLPVNVHLVECSRQSDDGSFQVVCCRLYSPSYRACLCKAFFLQVVVIPFCQRLEIGPHISPVSRSLFYELREDKVVTGGSVLLLVSYLADKGKVQKWNGSQIDIHHCKLPWHFKANKCRRGEGLVGHRAEQHSSVFLFQTMTLSLHH